MDYGYLAAATTNAPGGLSGPNAIVAAVGLGAVGLFLMLPREQTSWVKLGALIGTIGLAALFTSLAGAVQAVGGMPIYFYLFAFIMVAGAVGVICHPKPVYAALYFVLVTLAGAGIFVLLWAEFMAVVLIIVYAGAILVTYVFVIMLASQGKKDTPLYDRMASEPLVAVLVSFVLLGTILKVLYRDDVPSGAPPARQVAPVRADAQLIAGMAAADEANATTLPTPATAAGSQVPGNMQILGLNLYGQYALSLELAGVLLTIALVGAVMISRKNVEFEQTAGTGQLPIE